MQESGEEKLESEKCETSRCLTKEKNGRDLVFAFAKIYRWPHCLRTSVAFHLLKPEAGSSR